VLKEKEIKKLCNDLSIEIIEGCVDQTIVDVELILKDNKQPYITFGHFYNKLLKNVDNTKVKGRYKCTGVEWTAPLLAYSCKKQLESVCKLLGMNYAELLDRKVWSDKGIMYGGRKTALDRLHLLTYSKDKKNKTVQKFVDRDNLSEDKGLNISAYLNFGCVSSREVIEMFNPLSEEIFKQMAWRDFYICILRFNPQAREYVWLDDRYNSLKWRNTRSEQFKEEWNLFINCKTGCLIVDAAMNELKLTGFMNNRARLLWATFAVKYIQSNPFDKVYGAVSLYSRYLVDCNTSQNKMNFEWIISSLDIGGRRFAKRGESPLSGRIISLDNKHTLKKYNAYAYVRKWLPGYKDVEDKDLSKVIPAIDLKKRYQEYCDLFKKLA
jgi:deoxyribodipyrimidine photolyase